MSARFPNTSPPRVPQRRRVARTVASLLVAGLVAAGCAASAPPPDDPAATGGADAASSQGEGILAFVQCLRDQGLDVADPEPGGSIGLGPAVAEDPRAPAAIEHCRDEVDVSGPMQVGDMGSNMAEPAALLAFVDCMNEHGIPMDDPDPDGRLGIPEGVDPQSSDFQAAARACQPHLGGGGIRVGDGGGGGMVSRSNP